MLTSIQVFKKKNVNTAVPRTTFLHALPIPPSTIVEGGIGKALAPLAYSAYRLNNC